MYDSIRAEALIKAKPMIDKSERTLLPCYKMKKLHQINCNFNFELKTALPIYWLAVFF
jgi:hypothetical protein